jgi:hypothetical protein
VLSDKSLQSCEAACTVNINDNESGYGARSDADVGVGPFEPPCFDLAGVGGCSLKAAFHAGMLAGVFAEQEHRPSPIECKGNT